MDLKTTYNKIAQDFDNDYSQDTRWIPGTDKFLSYLASGASILDVGCGPGHQAKYLIEHGFKVTGIDLSEEMIKIAQKACPTGQFLVKDIISPLEMDTSFDGVYAKASLLHIPKNEIASVLKNITESLKSGGYLYVEVKEKRPQESGEMIVKVNDYGYEYERFFSYFSLAELKKYIAQLGYPIVHESSSQSPSGKTTWLHLVVQKP